MNYLQGSTSNQDKVIEFMRTFGQEVGTSPAWPAEAVVQMRLALIDEECDELHDGVDRRNIIEVADALTDILYVVYGMGATFGIDLDKCFTEVHNSNMSKLGEDNKPIYRDDGKVLKGPNYFEPDLDTILQQQERSDVGHP